MKAQRTPWWYYPVSMLAGLVLGIGAARVSESTSVQLVGAPWFIAGAMAVLGIIALVLALQVHRYVTAKPEERKSWIDPDKAVFTLVLCKSLGVAGALLAGWYLGQILLLAVHAEAPLYRTIVIQCAVTAVVCLADMAIGIVGEWLCQLPPIDGPEHPKTMRSKRASRSIAQPAAHCSKSLQDKR